MLETLEGLNYQPSGDNIENRDNQQERSMKLVWLAAMIEAEGTFTFQYNEQAQDGGLKCHIQPRVIFVNSDFALIERVDLIIKELGISTYRNNNIRGGLGKKTKGEVQVNGFKALPMLDALYPHLVGAKREVAKCLIEFIRYRQALPRRTIQYGDYEYSLVRRVRELNSGHWKRTPKFSLISSETVRQRREATWAANDAKIQSGLHGDMQSAAEMTAPPSVRKIARRRAMYSDYATVV